jgi:hypothetical protein
MPFKLETVRRDSTLANGSRNPKPDRSARETSRQRMDSDEGPWLSIRYVHPWRAHGTGS